MLIKDSPYSYEINDCISTLTDHMIMGIIFDDGGDLGRFLDGETVEVLRALLTNEYVRPPGDDDSADAEALDDAGTSERREIYEHYRKMRREVKL